MVSLHCIGPAGIPCYVLCNSCDSRSWDADGELTKFLYCGNCGNMRPRGWMFFTKRCEVCHEKMVTISVKMTRLTPVYYASLAATVVVLALFLAQYPLPFGTYVLLAMVILTMILAFIDYSLSYDRAKEMVKGDEERRRKTKP